MYHVQCTMYNVEIQKALRLQSLFLCIQNLLGLPLDLRQGRPCRFVQMSRCLPKKVIEQPGLPMAKEVVVSSATGQYITNIYNNALIKIKG